MQWNWASSIDELWRSPALPMWATLAAAGFSALIVLIILIRADKTMANGALAVITLLSIGIASTLAVYGFSGGGTRPAESMADSRPVMQQVAALPSLSCLDGLAGDSVETACEKAVFGSADATAAAVSYTAAQISRLANANSMRSLNAELQTLRGVLERDRFGLVAQALTAREKCTPSDCGMFRVVSDASTIRKNMSERLYDTLILRHSIAWNTTQSEGQPPMAALSGTNLPTGKPTSVEFPTAASTPPVNIMTPEPSPQTTAPTPPAAPRPAASANAQAPAKSNPPAKKQTQAAPKSAPTQIAPQTGTSAPSSGRPLYVPPQ